MITLENVSLKYKNEKNYIFKNLSLSLDGKIISIIGKNGTGKTSLVKLLSGTLSPTSGNIFINDLNLSNKKDFYNIRKKVAVVFQNPDNQIIFERVYEELKFGLKNLKFDDNTIEKNIDKALDLVGMSDYKFTETKTLSLGQKQKIIIAEALALDSDIIILDEPTAMLDPASKKQIFSLFQFLKSQGKTIIFVTHILEEIFYSDTCLLLTNNELIEKIKTSDILNTQELIKKINIDNSNFIFNLLDNLFDKNINIDFTKYDYAIPFNDFLLNEIVEKLK